MRGRCTNPNTPNFQNYGGRGIRVCDRWNDGDGTLSGFACFLADMGERPDGLTLDRIDNDKGYEPGNCRWATWTQQQNNRRSNIDVEAVMALRRQGLTKRDIAKRLGKNKDTVAIAILRATSGKEAQP